MTVPGKPSAPVKAAVITRSLGVSLEQTPHKTGQLSRTSIEKAFLKQSSKSKALPHSTPSSTPKHFCRLYVVVVVVDVAVVVVVVVVMVVVVEVLPENEAHVRVCMHAHDMHMVVATPTHT